MNDPLSEQPPTRRHRRRRALQKSLRVVAAMILLAWVFVPLYALILAAVQSKLDTLAVPPHWIPRVDWSNFRTIFENGFDPQSATKISDLILPGIRNSAIVAVVVALVNLVVGVPAAYALSRFHFPGDKAIPIALVGSRLVPVFAFVIPMFVVLRNLSLTNTLWGVAVADISITLPFTVWILRGYAMNLPRDVDRAARIDGYSRLGALVVAVIPLLRPGLVSVGLLAFIESWNSFVFPLVLNSSTDIMLIQPAIAGLSNPDEQNFGVMAAGTLIAALPPMLIALVFQRLLVKGLTAGIGKA